MLFLPLFLALSTVPHEADFYIGTYTSANGSKGIYQARLNTATGAISEPELSVEVANPSYVALHPNGHFLYAVQEARSGEVSAFMVGHDRRLSLLNTQSFKGADPCHLSVTPSGHHLFAAAYTGGSVACFPIKSNGSLDVPSSVVQNSGSGPDKSRQEGPHAHAIYTDARGRFVYSCDLGTDELLAFRLDSKKGALTPAVPRSSKTPAGGGPRHLAFHPNGMFVYGNNEMGNSVTFYHEDPATGALTQIQTLSTLPEGVSGHGNSTAEIALHPNGKWLYVSNRGHDSIAVYEVGEDGRLTLSEVKQAGVKVPRGFGIDPSGKWLVVAGQASNDLTALAIDPHTGRLAAGASRVRLDKPVCVLFAK
ncbi:lactonase family protein [Fimbriimonas ginsengisoli]|uniref:6-phosphogluconolactonase n=1 Tax=Fimbriimonas ginsengisoli Gsoil 348 TaxID=661478 RepID=A0A068NVC9_FIMGI|nr:lactonase family protein [Fimbriimonas ginsengisoli]AIE86730.1 6-phosphogluconolactonase [Fimbriimonas ginsengisoli Gsoil 348]